MANRQAYYQVVELQSGDRGRMSAYELETRLNDLSSTGKRIVSVENISHSTTRVVLELRDPTPTEYLTPADKTFTSQGGYPGD